jgi:zinc/manganese transport system substrate-binding protein
MRTILTLWAGRRAVLAAGLASTLALAACGDDDTETGAGEGRPEIVVTTNILGDLVREVVGEAANVDVVMPLGADPHEFSVSTRQAEEMVEADLLVVNGSGFEAGLAGVIDRAEDEGTSTFAFTDHVELLPFEGPDSHDEDEDDAHADEGEDEDDAHEDEGEGEEGDHTDEEEGNGHDLDPHVWTDPARMAEAVVELGRAVAELEGVEAAGVEERADAYADELLALDQEIEALLADVPPDGRVLVTNHEVFGYFADRYGFEVVGTVIPSGTTQAEPSSAELEDLAALIVEESVPAIFSETTQSDGLASSLADMVGEVEVVSLYTESLGEEGSGAETYLAMMRTNAELIAGALAGSSR